MAAADAHAGATGDGSAGSGEPAQRTVRPIVVACGIVIVCIVPLLVLLVVRGPVDGAGDTGQGFWGAKTASVNWCEADYVVTPYIAEFWNTMSSLAIVATGLYGIWMHWRVVELRYILAFGAFLVIGLGSCAFHGTLLRSMQLLDEVPMVWANSVFIYILIAMEDEKNREPRTLVIWIIACVTVLMTLAVAILDSDDQNVFLLCYGGGVVYIFGCSRWFNVKYNSMGSVVLLESSLLFYGGGFVLWLADRNFCPMVRSLYLHVFWHVCAGTGTFLAVLFWIWVRFEFLGLRPRVSGATPPTLYIEVGEKAV